MMQCKSGLVTMNNSCYNSIQQGEAANKAGNYSNALDLFNQVLQKCDAYDAKEKGYAGKAAALNGMQKYNDALDAASQGLSINKSSIDNLFEKATAELGLSKTADAKNDFNTIIDLTQKNRNTAERAAIYAKMGEIDLKQNMYADALNNVEQAISLDANNTSFYMLRGDIKAAQKNFTDAIAALLFKINSSELSESANAELDKLAGIFTKYPDTNILVEGHTDDTGTDEFNMALSEKRAKSVAGFLQSKGLPVERFMIKWYGENQPKYPNDSEANRIKNRRVELAIYANDEMKKEAQQGTLPQ